MNRRSFLRRLGAAVVALTLARHLPGIAPEPQTLQSPPGFSIEEFQMRYMEPAIAKLAHAIDSEILDFAVRVQG